MKTLKKTGAGPAVLLLSLTLLAGLLAITGCSSTSDGESERTPVADGTWTATGIGKSPKTPITVTATFANNVLTNIVIGANEETGPILDSVKEFLIPRIIEDQSIGVDNISGATLSSGGVKMAIAAAIDEHGGKSSEWYVAPPKKSGTETLTGFDVIVVGLGGSGMAAYLSAAEAGATVYGIEVAAKIGGNSATAGGPMAINSKWIKDKYGIGDYVNKDALLKEWYIDMEAEVPAGEMPSVTNFTGSNGQPAVVPPIGAVKAPYAGGPKWQLIKTLIDESGETVTWLAQEYEFKFQRPSALSYPQYTIVTNYAKKDWTDSDTSYFGPPLPGYPSDDNDDLEKTGVFTRAIDKAKARNAKNDYKLELKADGLIMSEGKVAGVKATYRDGTKYEIYGKAVILATGGFIANPDMMNQYYGSVLRAEAVHTEQGDGIRMALAQGAGTYNIDMPGTVHISFLNHIITENVAVADKLILSTLLRKGDSLVVGQKPNKYGDNFQGKRFANEGSGMGGGVAFENWRVGGYYAAIYSDDILEDYKTNGMSYPGDGYLGVMEEGIYTPGTPIPNLDAILALGERTQNVVRGSSLADLAQKLGIDAATLTATITAYNGYIDAGVDAEYGKHDVFGANYLKKPDGTPIAKINPEASGFTAILGAGYYYGSTGGLDVDEDIQVLNTAKAKIPGLYAVGQDSSGVLFNDKKAYVGYGAAAQGWAITSGRLAGENAAKEAKAAQ